MNENDVGAKGVPASRIGANPDQLRYNRRGPVRSPNDSWRVTFCTLQKTAFARFFAPRLEAKHHRREDHFSGHRGYSIHVAGLP